MYAARVRQAAIVRATKLDVRAVCQWNRSRLVVGRERRVGFGVGVDERGKRPTVGAALAHIDLLVTKDDLGIDNLSTAGTYAARKLMEHVVGIFPGTAFDRATDFTGGVKSSHGFPSQVGPRSIVTSAPTPPRAEQETAMS